MLLPTLPAAAEKKNSAAAERRKAVISRLFPRLRKATAQKLHLVKYCLCTLHTVALHYCAHGR
jgi:hypothetical protein